MALSLSGRSVPPAGYGGLSPLMRQPDMMLTQGGPMAVSPGMRPPEPSPLMEAMGGLPSRDEFMGGLAAASPLLIAMGQNMQLPRSQRDPRAVQMAAMQVGQQAQQRQAQDQAAQMRERVAQVAQRFPPEQRAVFEQMAKVDPARALQEMARVMRDGNERDRVGLNLVYGYDEQGRPVAMQATDSGELIRSSIPEGVTLSKQPIRVDTADGTVLIDPITREQIGFVAKNLAEAEAATVQGRTEGQRRADAPGNLRQAEEMLGIIDGVMTAPGLDNALGFGGFGVVPDIPGVNTDARARIAQLQGRTFLQAFESLKGGGQITEVEGQKAQEAIARLRTTQTPDEFRAALRDLRAIVETARARAAAVGSGQRPFDVERRLQGLSDDDLMRMLSE